MLRLFLYILLQYIFIDDEQFGDQNHGRKLLSFDRNDSGRKLFFNDRNDSGKKLLEN